VLILMLFLHGNSFPQQHTEMIEWSFEIPLEMTKE